jgi:hypothetical protein
MHGNESTTTKALFDLFKLLISDYELAKNLKNHFTFCFIPMLNPDGANAYTRVNANEVDLNRDFLDLSQPESKLLMNEFVVFQPDYCYNLHDQRTIFAAGDTNYPATLSFLAPAYNEEREINEVRQKAINVIADIYAKMQKIIPKQIGRFDDSFNRNCVGDCFQSLHVPTILFEAGHFKNDYHREETRKFVFLSLLYSFQSIMNNDGLVEKTKQYFEIPQNKVKFYDVIYRNVKIDYDDSDVITNIAVQYKEELRDGVVAFNAYVSSIGQLDDYLGHIEYDIMQELFSSEEGNTPYIDQKADFVFGKNKKITNGLLKKQ